MVRQEYYHDPDAPAANSLTPTAFAAVRDDAGRILLVRRADTGNWELPGGRVELGESAVVAAEREVAEESGRERLGQLQLGLRHGAEPAQRAADDVGQAAEVTDRLCEQLRALLGLLGVLGQLAAELLGRRLRLADLRDGGLGVGHPEQGGQLGKKSSGVHRHAETDPSDWVRCSRYARFAPTANAR